MTITKSTMSAIRRCVLMAAIVSVCVSCSPLAPSRGPVPLGPSEAGAILERALCTVNTNPRAFADAVSKLYLDDIFEAKLGTELAARPFASSYSNAENLRLAKAAQAGRCERVMYRSSGLRVVGFVLRPAGPGPHPVLIWLRGGHREYGKIEQVALLNLQWFADAGFVVVATQYRGADGGEGSDEFGGADVDDVMALLPLARALPGADVGRLYLLGNSRGGMQGGNAAL
jgi:acetyl esterase/lipase